LLHKLSGAFGLNQAKKREPVAQWRKATVILIEKIVRSLGEDWFALIVEQEIAKQSNTYFGDMRAGGWELLMSNWRGNKRKIDGWVAKAPMPGQRRLTIAEAYIQEQLQDLNATHRPISAKHLESRWY
jgi:hypothetical protein